MMKENMIWYENFSDCRWRSTLFIKFEI